MYKISLIYALQFQICRDYQPERQVSIKFKDGNRIPWAGESMIDKIKVYTGCKLKRYSIFDLDKLV